MRDELGNLSGIMDAQTAEYLASNAPDPSQSFLDKVFGKTTGLRFLDGGTFGGRALGTGVLVTVSDPEDIAALHSCLTIVEDRDTFAHCMCLGDQALELYCGAELLATIGVHHGRSVRWDAWQHDARLEDGHRLLMWLAARGATGPLRAYEAARRRSEESGTLHSARPQRKSPIMKHTVLFCAGLAVAAVACQGEPTAPERIPEPSSSVAPVETSATHYTLVNLGTLGGDWSEANAVNNVGQIVGMSARQDGTAHAFLWQDGTMRDLGTLGGVTSSAMAINGAKVVGNSNTASGDYHAFLWANGVMADLGTLGGTTSWGFGINSVGQVVGLSSTANGSGRSFLWQAGVMQRIAPLKGVFSRAFGINVAGDIVGDYRPPNMRLRAFLVRDGALIDLGTLGGLGSAAMAINRDGTVVGWANTASGARHATLWQNGTVRDLGTLGGNNSTATAISPLGVVVGSGDKGGVDHAFVWTNGVMTDLGPGLATGINRNGWIVGRTSTATGTRATLWRPD